MPLYSYKAKIRPNVFRTGTIEADSERAAVNKLLLLNYHPISVRPQTENVLSRFRILKKISAKDIYIFLRQLSNLLIGGLPIVKALQNISAQSSNSLLLPVIERLKERIQKGRTFSEALFEERKVFSPLEINMIKGAEASGTLPEVLSRLADLKEKDITFTHKLSSAIAYPLLVIGVGTITLFVLTTFVLPKFAALFNDLGQSLPLATYVLIHFSVFVRNFWQIILLTLLIGGAVLFKHLGTPKGRYHFDELKLKLPVIKDLEVKIQTARFARTMRSLLENGITVLNALQIVSEVMTNRVFAFELKHISTLVAQGQQLNEAMRTNNLFEKNTLDLIAIGEESGRLEEMLLRVTQMDEQEASYRIDSLVLLIEPVLILLLGSVIAFIVVAILLPIFQMNFLIK